MLMAIPEKNMAMPTRNLPAPQAAAIRPPVQKSQRKSPSNASGTERQRCQEKRKGWGRDGRTENSVIATLTLDPAAMLHRRHAAASAMHIAEICGAKTSKQQTNKRGTLATPSEHNAQQALYTRARQKKHARHLTRCRHKRPVP